MKYYFFSEIKNDNPKQLWLNFTGIFLLLLLASAANSFSQTTCGSISAEFNRTVRTNFGPSLTYTLYLQNKDLVAHNYTLRCLNDNSANPDGLTAEPKTIFKSELLDVNSNIINSTINLAPGEKIKFFVKLSIPENTPLNVWNCTKVEAETSGCGSFYLRLFSFYPNPNDHE